MTNTVRFALIGASLLALTSPVLARNAIMGPRMTCHQVTDGSWRCSAPVSLSQRERAYPAERAFGQPMHGPNADLQYGPQRDYPQSPAGGGY